MRLFVYEYLTAHLHHNPTGSLRDEGWAMLSAVTEDFARIPGSEVCTILSSHCAAASAGCSVERFDEGEEESTFRRLAGCADLTLVIAPEFDNLLLRRCHWVEDSGGRLLGPTSAAVALTADKLALARHLFARNIPTPATVLATADPPCFSYPVVCKPRYGAGSQAVFLVRNREEWPSIVAAARREAGYQELLCQPFLPGRAASVAFLIGPAQVLPLVPTAQHLSDDGRFHYQGGSLPLPSALAERAERTARRAVESVPGLNGYVGVDLVLGTDPSEMDDAVIEINPRLTTSYVGLRALAECNLAEAMVAIAQGGKPPPLCWRTGAVTFWADGSWQSCRT